MRSSFTVFLLKYASNIVFKIAFCVLLGLGCTSSDKLGVSRVDPPFAGLQGGKTVQIVGSGFRANVGYTVYFGGQKSDRVAIVDSNRLSALTPRVADPKTVDVIVRSDTGESFRLQNAFRYVNENVSIVEGL
ncbi:MAG: IPT/TIG domain-containing protein [Polyangiales bacterium]